MNNDSKRSVAGVQDNSRALVLGGGGAAGNAWLIGVIAGLYGAGVDVTKPDVIIGTSAGSTAAAQITAASPAELYAQVFSPAPPRAAGPAVPGAGRGPMAQAGDQMQKMKEIIAGSKDLAEMRRKMGALALENDAGSDGSRQTQWRSIVATRLPSQEWPEQLIQITAVDAHTGKPVIFDRYGKVDLIDAVAASCAGGGFAYGIGGRSYIDGGYRRSSENADLAAGYERVLVLSPLGGRSLHPLAWGSDLATQVSELRAGGSRVEIILPDDDSRTAFGDNMMNPAARQPAAQAGYSQGKALAARLAEFWR